MKFLRVIFLFWLAGLTANAATLCVKQSSSGSANGADWDNALGAGFTPVRGNTYYLADGSYGAFSGSVATSGSTLITIKKATVADHATATGWSDTMGDGAASFTSMAFSTSYWYIDGQVGGGPTSWTSGFGFVVYNTSTPVVTLSGTVNHITIRHTAIGSDRGATTDPGGTTGSGFGGGIKGTTGACSDITVSYCAITNIYGPIFHIGAWTDTTVEYCYLARNRSTASWHSEGVSSINGNTNCVWRWNIWDQVEGTAVFAGVNSGSSSGWKIYGSIFSRCVTPIYYYWEGGGNQNSMSASLIHQNTIVACGVNSQGAFNIDQGTGNFAYNNLFYSNDANAYNLSPTHDYTYASQNIRSQDGPFDKDGDIISGEAHGQNGSGDPFTDYNANPLLADLSAITDAGKSDLGAPYNTDMFGNTLTNRGAIGFASGGGDVTAPTLNTATIPSAGNTITLAFSENVSIGAGGNAGWSLTMSGGAVTLTYSFGSGTSSLVYSLSRTVNSGETVSVGLNYTQPGNGIEDGAGNDLATLTGKAVTNNSTQSGNPVNTMNVGTFIKR